MKLIHMMFLLVAPLAFAYGDGTCHRTNCKHENGSLNVTYISMGRVSDKKFSSIFNKTKTIKINHQLSQKDRQRECVMNCNLQGIDICLSAHLSPYSPNTSPTCTLFKEDVYNHRGDVQVRIDDSGFTSFHVWNSFCEQNPCQGSSRCVPNFIKDMGTCECHKGYSGRYCETYDPLKGENVGHWVFDNYFVENIGSGASTLGHGKINPTYATILGVPDRRGKVIQCNAKGVKNVNEICFAAPEEGKSCFTSFETQSCPDGFIYSFWFRVNQRGDWSNIMTQPTGASGGFAVVYGSDFHAYLEYSDYAYVCKMDQYKNVLHLRWNLFAIAYDPNNEKFYCYFNQDFRMEMTKMVSGKGPMNPFGFNGQYPFFIDDVVFLPYFVSRGVEFIYNKTRQDN